MTTLVTSTVTTNTTTTASTVTTSTLLGASMMIGPEGGAVEFEGARIVIPAGALADTQTITIRRAAGRDPAGYTVYSPIYDFGPAALTFDKEVSVSIPFAGDPSLGALFLSRGNGAGFERLGGTTIGSVVTANTVHIGTGFVADGVQYTDPPDLSCTVARLLEGRTLSNSSIALFFTVDDCGGRPVAGLEPGDFVLTEDGSPLSVEADAVVLPQKGLQVFLTLALDVSGSTSAYLPQIIAGAKAVVQRLQVQEGLPVQIGIEVFSGTVILWQAHTLDTAQLLSRLDALLQYTPSDLNSTNLHGVIISGLQRLDAAQGAFRDRNFGGAFTTGYLMLFTDGRDTTGQYTAAATRSAVASTKNQILAVGLQSLDYDRPALALLAPFGVLTAASASALQRDFAATANRVAGQVKRSYALSYCSPKRFGDHSVAVGVLGGALASYGFFAGGFTDACNAAQLATACDGFDCGGLGCGACDDRLGACDSDTRQCVSFCQEPPRCDGQITNPRGYTQACTVAPGRRELCVAEPDRWYGFSNTDCCTDQDEALRANCAPSFERVHVDSGTSFDAVCDAAGKHCVEVCDWMGTRHACSADGGTRDGSRIARCRSAQFLVCTDLVNDARHCGACGTMCLIGCTAGTCVSVGQLETGSSGAFATSLFTAHTCARLTDGTVRCWGDNFGSTPRPVADLTNVAEIAAGYIFTCARLTDSTARCWGVNDFGQLGDGTTNPRSTPTAVAGLTNVAEITAGFYHTCARLTDGTARCWGADFSGQLGDGGTFPQFPHQRSTPTAVAGLTNVAEIAAGDSFTCARLTDGTARCWGDNSSGQLGDGTTIPRSAPTAVAGLTNVAEITAGRDHACARLIDGTARCWGGNAGGQLGDGTTNPRNTPTAVAGLTTVAGIAAGGSVSCARLTDGTARCWGDNSSGQLGDGSTIPRSAPTAVAGLTNVAEITAGGDHTCARLIDGTARCWGANVEGELGDGTTDPHHTPTSVVW